jgi:outer membrane protein assembly factor BamE (lipoprotein component of BamABCDE complex)
VDDGTVAHAEMVEKAKGIGLSISEWTTLSNGMSKDEIVGILGRPVWKRATFSTEANFGEIWYYPNKVTTLGRATKNDLVISWNFDVVNKIHSWDRGLSELQQSVPH